MLYIAAADSDQEACRQLATMIHQCAQSQGIAVTVEAFDRVDRFLTQYEPVYDIVFLGVESGWPNVPEMARRLRKRDGEVALIFLTGSNSQSLRFSEEAELLPKPLNEESFRVKFLRAVDRVGHRSPEQILLKTSDGARRLEIRQIYYLETRSRMLYYHTANGVHCVRGSLQNAQRELADYPFAKCNQCYLVNLGHVSDVRDDCVVVAQRPLEISRRNKKAFLEALMSYIETA